MSAKKFKKIFKDCEYYISPNQLKVMGEKMTDFIWYWTKGNSRFFTRKTEVAEEAMKEGELVLGMKVKPNIIKY